MSKIPWISFKSHAQIKAGFFSNINICYKLNKNSLFIPNKDHFKTPAFWLVSFHNSQFSLVLISPSFWGQITTDPNPHHQAGVSGCTNELATLAPNSALNFGCFPSITLNFLSYSYLRRFWGKSQRSQTLTIRRVWCGGLHKRTRNAHTKLRFSGENPPLFFTPAAVVCCGQFKINKLEISGSGLTTKKFAFRRSI